MNGEGCRFVFDGAEYECRLHDMTGADTACNECDLKDACGKKDSDGNYTNRIVSLCSSIVGRYYYFKKTDKRR